jgi:4-amino-4-deoxy-L-arabinose transferase-like glycosyltransferase
MTNRLFLALACVLFVVRLPSLVQPMGADQSLYAYVGERILDGGLPYRDAWDQKPPAIHFTYAGLRAAWAHDSVVPAADLVAALAVTALLYGLGVTLATPLAGQAAALMYLFLSNPAFQRLSGVSVRAQCETFIAVAVSAAFLIIARTRDGALWKLATAGALFGLAFTFKYNTAVYAAVGAGSLLLLRRWSLGRAGALAAGFAAPVIVLLAIFIAGGSMRDLYAATIDYNLQYSGETYAGPRHFLTYLLTFPIQHAAVDGLWLAGGAGCAILLAASFWKRERLLPVAWVAAACLSIAINGSRGLPQYFVQALPALALAAGWALSLVWTRKRAVNALGLAVLAFGIWRVNEFQNLAANTWHDTKYLLGRSSLTEHLARYGDRESRKYSALAVWELGQYLREKASPSEHVYVFGFASGAYVHADRVSSSRFFWSRPVIVGFKEGERGYGVQGLLQDLQNRPPAVVALQLRDWAPDVLNSAEFFLKTAPLADWLIANYTQAQGPDGFDIWTRRGTHP